MTDAELILQAYARWGERCPEHLLGDFAFALWDARRGLLFCARDHFGVKPFYYHYRPGRLFAFASEIKGLLVLSEVPRRLNETRVADYLVPLLEDKEITFYEEIVRLPPAHRIAVTREGVRIDQYWALDPEREIRMKSDAEYADAFREIFTEAVRCRLRSAFPVGSMLSGGLDSSSIVCVARKLLAEDGGGKLHTFSAIFPDVPECDEREYIEAVVAGGGVEPHYVRADRLSPLADLERVLQAEDEPFYAPNLFLHWALGRAAGDNSVRVILDGYDGDTTLWQRPEHLADLLRSGRWMAAGSEVRGLAQYFDQSAWRVLWRYGIRPLVPPSVRRLRRRIRGRGRPPWRANGLILPSFATRAGLPKRSEALEGVWWTPASSSREDHWRRLTVGIVPFVLEVADRIAAAFGLEPRYPFCDRRLVELCLALPAEQKLHLGWTRVVLRRGLAHVLPAQVRSRRRKSNLS
ncbi:MAG: asparagine synthetase B, partial [Cyanobacteria bacterium 13_1_40CM_2_61_4]